MARYIRLPIEVSSIPLLGLAVNYIKSKIIGWVERPAELDYILLQSNSLLAAEVATIASRVPDSIFRYFGSSLLSIMPEDASSATVTSTWTAINNAGYTINAGTYVGIVAAGDQVIPFQVMSSVVIPPGALATAAGEVTLIAAVPGADGSGLGGVGAPAQLIDALDWVDTIVLTGITTGGIDAETDADYLDRLAAELRLLSPRPILPGDFAVLARETEGVWRATAIDGYQPLHNKLTANQASAETDATGWVGNNAAIASTGAQAADGIKSVQVTASSAADMYARTPETAVGVPVVPGQLVTGLVSMRSAATVRSCKAQLAWLDGSNIVLSTTDGTAGNDSTTGWTIFSVQGVAPAGAVSVRLRAYVTAPANAEVHYADKASIRLGGGFDWVAGGTSDYGNERMVTVAALDESGLPVSGAVKTAIQADLDARRETNFIVNVTDPNVVTINVVYQVKKLPTVSGTDLLTTINTAIQDYLSSLNWGLDPNDKDPHSWVNQQYLRYLELSTVINNVFGVDYIVSLTFGVNGTPLSTADIQLPGVSPLPTVALPIGGSIV